jgi:membrane associated rhomboid family serine protease
VTAAPTQHCYRHPGRETGVRCVRCDRPICPECMRPASVGFQCPDDVRIGQASIRAPRTSMGAPVRWAHPYTTWTIIALNVVVYLVTALTSVNGLNEPEASHLLQSWQLTPVTVATNHQYYRLVTSMFLHVNLLHIVMNMIALIWVGQYLERLLGPARYLAVYLLGGLGGSVAVFLVGARFTPVVGASGAIFGLFGACLLMVRELGFDPWVLIVNIVLNFMITFSIPGISRLGHLGGFVVGVLAGLVIAGWPQRRRRLPVRYQLAGLGAIFVVLLAGVAWRTHTLKATVSDAASVTPVVRGAEGWGAEGLHHGQNLLRISPQGVAAQHHQ